MVAVLYMRSMTRSPEVALADKVLIKSSSHKELQSRSRSSHQVKVVVAVHFQLRSWSRLKVKIGVLIFCIFCD